MFNPNTPPQEDHHWDYHDHRTSPKNGYNENNKERGLGTWILIAIVASISAHLYLLNFAGKMDWSSIVGKPNSKNQSKQRVSINSDLLKKGEVIKELKSPVEKPDNSLFNIDKQLAEIDVQNRITEETLKLTPSIEQATRLIAKETTPIATKISTPMLDLLNQTESQNIEKEILNDIAAMKKRMAEQPKISDNQLVLEAGEDLGLDNIDDDMLSQLESSEDSTHVAGFSDLDKLLSISGGLPENLDPLLLPTDLLFGYNEIELKDSARDSLMKLAWLIQKNPKATFTIEGHSDSFGSNEANLALSQKRADAVKSWLINTLYIEGDKINTLGRGENHHLAPSTGTIEEQAINRRVEIVIDP